MSGGWLLLANLAAALLLTGLSWFLQVVQLPLLARLNTADFTVYAALHRRRNTLLMAPLMIVELATAAWLGVFTPEGLPHRDLFHLFLLLVAIWLITFLRHVPLHARLLRGYDAGVIRSIERWNLARTLCWTARSVFLLMVVRAC